MSEFFFSRSNRTYMIFEKSENQQVTLVATLALDPRASLSSPEDWESLTAVIKEVGEAHLGDEATRAETIEDPDLWTEPGLKPRDFGD